MDAFQVVEASGYVPHEWLHSIFASVMAVIAAIMLWALIRE